MKLKYAIRYISKPAEIIMVLVAVLVITMVLQSFVSAALSGLFGEKSETVYFKPQMKMVELPAEAKKLQRISDSQKRFMCDGTIHLHCRRPYKRTYRPSIPGFEAEIYSSSSGEQLEIYDADDNLIWTGEPGTHPYTYLPSGCSIPSGGCVADGSHNMFEHEAIDPEIYRR